MHDTYSQDCAQNAHCVVLVGGEHIHVGPCPILKGPEFYQNGLYQINLLGCFDIRFFWTLGPREALHNCTLRHCIVQHVVHGFWCCCYCVGNHTFVDGAQMVVAVLAMVWHEQGKENFELGRKMIQKLIVLVIPALSIAD